MSALKTEFDRMKHGECTACKVAAAEPLIIFNDNFAWCNTCKSKVYDTENLFKKLSETEKRLEALINWMQETSASSLPGELINYE